ncbi:hypothetical protein FKP32DRAFT_1607920 [Trametes sanguinea]|nr:hypothetical protein FKP32DRAFT_1607920 [Trametes sanguinea]
MRTGWRVIRSANRSVSPSLASDADNGPPAQGHHSVRPETSTTSKKKKAPKGHDSRPSRAAPSEPGLSIRETAPKEKDSEHSPAVIHGYGTRRSTQQAHPGRAVGLERRSREAIAQVAAEKRAAKAQKTQEKVQKSKRVTDGLRRVAELENEFVTRQAEEDRLLRAPPSPQAQSAGKTLPLMKEATSSQARRATQGHAIPRETPVDDDDDDDPDDDGNARVILTTPTRVQPPVPEGSTRTGFARNHGKSPPVMQALAGLQHYASDSSSDTEADTALSLRADGSRRTQADVQSMEDDAVSYGDPVADIPDGHTGFADWRSDGRYELEDDAADIFDDADLDNNDDDGEDLALESDEESDHSHDDMAAKVMQSKARSRKNVKRTLVRTRIDEFRKSASSTQHRSPLADGSAKRARNDSDDDLSPPPRVRAKKAQSNATNDAFRPGWRPKPPQGRGIQTDGDRVSADDRPSSVGWRAALQGAGRASGTSTPTRDAPAREAFTEADVHSSRSYAVNLASTPNIHVQRLADGDGELAGSSRTVAKKTPRQARRAPTDVPEHQSRSVSNIPDVLKPLIYSKIIPTVLDYYGAKEDPWAICQSGRKGTELVELCQDIISEVCPRFSFDVSKADVVYKVIRQHIYEWRNNFANMAVEAINDAIMVQFGSRPSPSAANDWVRAAIMDSGEAFWAHPHPDPAQARGKMQSPYILKSFATHLIATSGSVRDYGYPGGALALAAAAVQHIFPMFRKGTFKPGKGFTETNVTVLTESWYRRVHRAFVEKPEKFEALILNASRHSKAAQPRRNRVGNVEAPDVFDRSSPALEETDDMMLSDLSYKHLHI